MGQVCWIRIRFAGPGSLSQVYSDKFAVGQLYLVRFAGLGSLGRFCLVRFARSGLLGRVCWVMLSGLG